MTINLLYIHTSNVVPYMESTSRRYLKLYRHEKEGLSKINNNKKYQYYNNFKRWDT